MNQVAIIGLGRVGLPFALFLEQIGFSVHGIDKDENLIERVKKKKMPFHEHGCDELLAQSRLSVSTQVQDAAKADFVVITVGTPLSPHIETDLTAIRAVLKDLAPTLRPGQTLILRSTVAPETTLYLKNYLEMQTKLKVGVDIGLAFCPERLAENQALHELKILPQIIGCEDELSKRNCAALFQKFGVKLFYTNYVSAELAKLFNNSSRYIEFAVANQFAIIANQFDQNIYEILRMTNEDYIRGRIASPGLTAGTCLRKDFGFINERSSTPDLLLSAWKVNEYIPFHMVDSLAEKTSLHGKKIAVLGYSFKKNTDDTRDSLVPKLIRYIERKNPKEILVCEPNINEDVIEGWPNHSLDNALAAADVVFLAINHDQFTRESTLENARPGTWFVDLWNCLKLNKFVFQKNE